MTNDFVMVRYLPPTNDFVMVRYLPPTNDFCTPLTKRKLSLTTDRSINRSNNERLKIVCSAPTFPYQAPRSYAQTLSTVFARTYGFRALFVCSAIDNQAK